MSCIGENKSINIQFSRNNHIRTINHSIEIRIIVLDLIMVINFLITKALNQNYLTRKVKIKYLIGNNRRFKSSTRKIKDDILLVTGHQ